MKIYVPTPITTEAEAEALPAGTHVVIRDEDLTTLDDSPLIYVKSKDGVFEDWQGYYLMPSEIVPVTALVEREVRMEYSTEESERRWGFDGVYDTPEMVRQEGWKGTVRERAVTEWRDLA